jgi:Protein of unknown function (DUF3089)
MFSFAAKRSNMQSLRFVMALPCLALFFSCSPSFSKYTAGYTFKNKKTVPDYANENYWAALPSKKDLSDSVSAALIDLYVFDNRADVFFIHPTTFTDKNSPALNADINDVALNAKTDYSTILYQASAFNQYAIYAPRYRQAHLRNYFSVDSVTALTAFNIAYSDVKNAFQYYLDHYNNGRPIIIASHSQGTTHAKELLKEFFDGKPLQKQLVAAYLTGMYIPENYYTTIPVGKNATQTGCVLAWRTYAKGYMPGFVNNEKIKGIVVNPLTWTTDSTNIPASLNKGGILKKYNKLTPNVCNAVIHEGILWINKPNIAGSFLINMKNYHVGDINLFYMNIRENIQRRVSFFLKIKLTILETEKNNLFFKNLAEKFDIRWLIAIMLLSFLLKSSLHYYYSLVIGSSDGFLQMALADEISKGNGYTIPATSLNNLNFIHHKPILNWPPLFSYIAAPLLCITNNNYELTGITIGIIFSFLHQLFWLLLLKQLRFSNWVIAIMLILQGTAIPEYMTMSTPTDMPAIVIWLATLYFTFRYLHNKNNWNLLWLCLFNVLPAFMRYVYLPVVFVLPVLFIWSGIKQKPLFKAGVVLFISTVIIIAAWLLHNKQSSGELVFLQKASKGFFPENLLSFTPIFWHSFLNVDFFGVQISKYNILTYSNFIRLLNYTSLPVLIFLTIIFLRKGYRFGFKLSNSTLPDFFLISAVLSLTVFLVIVFLTVYQNAYLPFPSDYFWTYLSESRYLILINNAIFIFLFYLFFIKKITSQPLLVMRFIFIVLIIIETLHGVYFIGRHLGKRYEISSLPWLKKQTFLDEIIKKSRNKNITPVLISYDYDVIAYGIFSDVKIVPQINETDITINTTNQNEVLIFTKRSRNNKKTPFDKFITKYKLEEVRVEDMSFYCYYLNYQ